MKKIVVFGASGYGRKVAYLLDDKEYEIVAFIDNSSNRVGMIVSGGGEWVIDSPKNIGSYEFDYVIISASEYASEMKEQLLSLGVVEDIIYVFQPNYPDIKWNDERVAMLRLCLEKLKRENVLGNMAELGVYKGDFAKYLNRYFPDRKLYLFDTFSGFAKEDSTGKDNIGDELLHFRDTSIEEVLTKMNNQKNIIIKKGYFPDTVKGIEDEFCFVSLDADLYLPILNGLEYFYPRLQKGGYIFIHDCGMTVWDGAKKAVDEYCKKYNISYVPILDRCASIIITK